MSPSPTAGVLKHALFLPALASPGTDPDDVRIEEWASGEVSRRAEAEEGSDDSVAPTGKFRVYLGAVAGVGKTWAMLDEGWRRYKRGADVVIGFVETHGRAHTAQQIRDLPVVARKVVEYRGTRFEEMDLAAVLARKPEVALIDELAHTNVPGSGPHAKRWEDVLEILEAGISVVSTVNIQHLESVADAVQQITGVAVRERVPDWVVRRADQLELIDSSPEQLRRRMLHGNVYPAEKIPDALNSFFRHQNLVALRELALRFVADETEEELLAYLVARHPDIVWDTAERIMVAVTGSSGTDTVLRRAARIAARVHADLQAVHVVADDSSRAASKDALGGGQAPRRRPGRELARDRGRRPRPGARAVRKGPPDHPDRARRLPTLALGADHEPGLGRATGAALCPPGRRRRARHRPLRRAVRDERNCSRRRGLAVPRRSGAPAREAMTGEGPQTKRRDEIATRHRQHLAFGALGRDLSPQRRSEA